MISERDFVLNNFYAVLNRLKPMDRSDHNDKIVIKELKLVYDLICENTSDINDDSFWLTGYERIRFSDITKVHSLGDQILEVKCIGMLHQLFGEDIVKFKEWFERKRGVNE